MWFIASCSVNDSFTPPGESVVAQNDGINAVTLPPNGTSLNGIALTLPPNGTSLSGVTLTLPPNGISLNGIDPTGLSADGAPIGISGAGAPLAGAELVGSIWTGSATDGTTIAIRVDEAMQGTGANADVWSYRMSASVAGSRQPLCHDHDGNPSFADSVSGTWNVAQGVRGGGSYRADSSEFTLACRGSSIAKCVELGYKPWNGYAPELASCVRALRADYCGDGTPYTVNGTLVNLFDDEGVRTDAVDWVPEAEWTPDGAKCVSKKTETRFYEVLHRTPTCYPTMLKPEKSCGTGFTDGTEVITELAPQ
jgi:hypothetical protein